MQMQPQLQSQPDVPQTLTTQSLLDNQQAQAMFQSNPNEVANMVNKQATQLINVSFNDQMKQMAAQHDTITNYDLSAFSENERTHILNKSQAITDYILAYDPTKHGNMYLHEIVLASDAQNDKIMQTMNGKADVMNKTLSDLSSSSRHSEHTDAMMVITEILNENQGNSTLSSKLKRFFKTLPIVGPMLNKHVIPLLEEYQNGKKTINEILDEVQRILLRTEADFGKDITRLLNVRDQLQMAKHELRKQSAITENAIAMVQQKMQSLPEENQKAITEVVLSPLSSQLSINTQKIGVSSQYIIAVETGIDGNKILLTTSKETREVCIYAMNLSFLLDDTLALQEKAIKQQQGVRTATDQLLKNNAKRLNQNAQQIERLATTSSLNPQTFEQTSQQVIAAAEKLAETKRNIFANNMKVHDDILKIEKELNQFSHDSKNKLVKDGMQNTQGGITNQSNNQALQNLFS